MSRWFRYYDDALNDPKVQRLSGDLFKAWVNLLCLASHSGGTIKSLADAAFALRLSEAKAGAVMCELARNELMDPVTGGYFEPHNWNGRQFKSDVSNERVKRHREQVGNGQCNVTSTVTVTPPETEADTENRTEQKDTSLRSVSVKADRNPKGWPTDFQEQFWSVYPKKVEKKAAFRRLEQVRRGGEIGFIELLAAVRAIKTADPQFIKHPATWLNKGCYFDGLGGPSLDQKPAYLTPPAGAKPLDEILAAYEKPYAKAV